MLRLALISGDTMRMLPCRKLGMAMLMVVVRTKRISWARVRKAAGRALGSCSGLAMGAASESSPVPRVYGTWERTPSVMGTNSIMSWAATAAAVSVMVAMIADIFRVE